MVLAWVDTDVVRVRGDEQVQTVNKQCDPAKTIDGVSLFAQCSRLKTLHCSRAQTNAPKFLVWQRQRF